jgi:hypothetical protein
VRRRGGTVVLLPDRRPSGPYLELMPRVQFEELLVNTPIAVRSNAGGSLRASELAIPGGDAGSYELLASADHGKTARPVVVGYPEGAGLVIFSGALDAWRFRAADATAFSSFWRSRVAEAALAAPRWIEIEINPSVVRPGETVTIRARLRATEFDDRTLPLRMPSVSASLVSADGREQPLRLWPNAETGVFEGSLEAPASGRYDVRVSADADRADQAGHADDVLTVMDDAVRPAVANGADRDQLVANATGGVVADASDLAPIERYLRSLSRSSVQETRHPTRSPWFVVLFAALLSSEWAIRRRRGRA